MDEKLLAALNRQIGVELGAEATYKSARYWADAAGWKGLSKWSKRAHKSEHDDAAEIMDAIVDSGEFPSIPAVAAPESKFTGLADVLNYAAELEVTNLGNIQALHDLAVKVGDVVVTVFLEGMLIEQRESVTETAKWAKKGQAAGTDPAALELLDRKLGRGKV